MSAELMVEAFALTQEVWELEEGRRQEVVAARCAGRPDLLAAVGLIGASPTEGSFDAELHRVMEDLLPEMAAEEKHEDPMSGSTVGSYRVGEVLGEGGMGRVYQATHAEHGGVAALKVLRSRRDGNRERIARLRHEAKLLARCRHAGIVQIYHLDSLPGGGVYFTMELVEGLPLTEHCAAEGLSFAERLRLFLRVCEAVEAAHGVGVIHRDLKPSNILAKGDGVKLLDFGVAEAFGDDEAEHCAYRSAPYAAPEHADETTVRTDVYSLGVVLAELLVNKAPAERLPAREDGSLPLRDLAGAAEAMWLQGVGRVQWAELEAVCGRATQNDPALRYGAVRELTEEVQRMLDGKPVVALQQAGRWRWMAYAGWRALGRHALGVGIVAVLMVLGAAALVSYRHALRAERLVAEGERHTEEQRHHQQELLAKMFVDGDGSVSAQTATRALLERAIHQAEVIALDPEQKAGLYEAFAEDFELIGDNPRADALFQQALALDTKLYGAESPEAAAVALQQAGQLEVEGHVQEGLDLARRTREELVKRLPVTDIRVLRADVVEAEKMITLGDYAGAKPKLENAVQLESGDPGRSADLSTALNDLGNVENYLGDNRKSIELQERSMAIDRVNEGPRHVDIGEHLMTISNCYLLLREPDKAVQSAREGLDILSASLGPDHHDVNAAERQLAASLVLAGNYAEAEPLFRKALDGLRREARDSQTLATSLLQYGDLLRDERRLDDALRSYQEGLAMAKRLFPSPNQFWASSYFGIGTTELLLSRLGEAEAAAREALGINIGRFGESHVRTLQTEVLLSRVLAKEGRLAEARVMLQRCLQGATGGDPASQQVIEDARGVLVTLGAAS